MQEPQGQSGTEHDGGASRPARAGVTCSPDGASRTIADYMAVAVGPYVSDELLSSSARDDIRKVAGLLPGTLSDFFGFECALGDNRASADFLVCCRARHGSLEKLASGSTQHGLPSVLQHCPAWQRIQAMAQEWVRPDSLLRDAVHNLWFEFDINDARSPPQVPNVFIGSHRLRPSGPCHGIEDIGPICAWLTELALPMLAGRAVDPAVARQVAKCLNSLPDGAFLFQVGLMLARDLPMTRLCARGLASGEIVPYLDRLAWPGALGSLAELLQSLDQIVMRVDLDLDVNDRVLPKVGLECYVDSEPTSIDAFVAYLVSRKLCTKAKARAIAMWPGIALDEPPSSAQQEQFAGSAADAAAAPRGVFVRRLHHVKLDFAAAQSVRAKAYLGVHHKEGGAWHGEQQKVGGHAAQVRIPVILNG